MTELDEVLDEVRKIYNMFNHTLMMKLKADDILYQIEGRENKRNRLLALVIKAGAKGSELTLRRFNNDYELEEKE